MATLKKAPKPKRVKVFRPKKTPQQTYSSTPKPPQKQGFSFIPQASAMPAPFIVDSVTVGVKKTLQKMPQIVHQGGLQPARAKKGKKIYRPPASLLEPSSLGVIKAGNGTPKYSSNYKLFAKKRPDKVFGKLAAATRLEQSNVMQFSPKMQQHKITPLTFKAITPGGPKLGPGEMYRTKTRYDKMGTKRTVANTQLVQGVSPTVRTVSPGDQLAQSTYTKFVSGNNKPESTFKQSTLFGVAGTTAAGTALFDQVNNFFNPFPEAHASVGPSMLKLADTFLINNPKGTYSQFLAHIGQGTRGNAATKKVFQEQQKLHKQQQQTITPSTLQTPKPGLSDKKQKGWLLGATATGLGIAGVGGVVSQGGFLTSPLSETPPTDFTDPNFVPPIVVVDETLPMPPPPLSGLGTENKGGTGQRDLQALQDEAMLGMQTAAASSSTLPPGNRRTIEQDADPSFTQVTYDRYVADPLGGKGTVEEVSQWMRFAGTDKELAKENFLASQATVLKNQQQNDVHKELLSVLGAIDPNTSTGMHDKSKAAKKFYKDNPTLGKLPQQWNVLFEATKPSHTKQLNAALEQHYTGGAVNRSTTGEQISFGYTYPEGHEKAGQPRLYPEGHEKAGQQMGIWSSAQKTDRPAYDEHGNRIATWLQPPPEPEPTPETGPTASAFTLAQVTAAREGFDREPTNTQIINRLVGESELGDTIRMPTDYGGTDDWIYTAQPGKNAQWMNDTNSFLQTQNPQATAGTIRKLEVMEPQYDAEGKFTHEVPVDQYYEKRFEDTWWGLGEQDPVWTLTSATKEFTPAEAPDESGDVVAAGTTSR